MITAAIYCRKSTDDSDKNEDARSTTRQTERAREFAAKRGWRVLDDHIYVDEAVSGAEWKERHAFNRLLAALDGPVPPFQALVVMELSRIGRDSVRTPYFIQQIEESGVQLWGYLSGQQISLADESSEIQTVFSSLAASFEKRRASQRTRDALRRRAEQGYVAGGRLFGYRNVRENGFVKRAVDADEAATVRNVFRWYVDGAGIHAIAKRLNAEKVPAPRPRGWSQGGINAMLQNRSYEGVVSWGKVETLMRRGTKALRRRDPKDVVTLEQPHLRIVSQALWNAAQARREQRRASYPRSRRGGALMGRPALQDKSEYLLPGFATCLGCGGPIRITVRGSGQNARRRYIRHYTCAVFETRCTCPNNVVVRQAVLDRAVIASVASVLDGDVLAAAVERAVERLRAAHQARADRTGQLRREVQALDGKTARLVSAIASGEPPAALIEALRGLEGRKAALAADLEREAAAAQAPAPDEQAVRGRLARYAEDVRGLLLGTTQQGRTVLRRMLAGPIAMEPWRDGAARGYRFTGTLTINRLFAGEAGARPTVTTPAGY